jgi:UDP-glucose 4-epimerase
MKNIIITGATSFIGIHLIPALIKKNYNIFAVVRPNSKKINLLPQSERVKIIELEMCEYKNLCNIINVPCQLYFSLAWNGTRGSNRDDVDLQKKNYIYSIDGLNSALKLGCIKILSAGSQAEYGPQSDIITEQTLPNPSTEYGKQKLAYYQVAIKLSVENNVDFIEPRFFSLYGLNDSNETMVISMLKKMLNNEDCTLTECIQSWDFLHINDAVNALIMLMEKDCVNGIYNFGSGCSMLLKSYIEIMHSLTNSKSCLQYGKIPYPPTGIISLRPNVSKLKSQLNWEPKISFEEGITDIIKKIKGVSQ